MLIIFLKQFDLQSFLTISDINFKHSVFFVTVCDVLLLGIPHEAWYVVMLVVFCLGVALTIPSFLPSYLLPRNENLHVDEASSKDSWLPLLCSGNGSRAAYIVFAIDIHGMSKNFQMQNRLYSNAITFCHFLCFSIYRKLWFSNFCIHLFMYMIYWSSYNFML